MNIGNTVTKQNNPMFGIILATYSWNEPYAIVQFNLEKPEAIPCRELTIIPKLNNTELKIKYFLEQYRKLTFLDHEIRDITEKMKVIFEEAKNEI